ncbi:efflux transporter, outer membrane factor (OMF) lipoprotein, NodT family [Mariprofundus ferrinatatus]|uniref:Efflux transporter, outer membrane factor (OMF) lipoprotein, NodT family n=1 Tax=Mariprofundus ferrinatatus TaxID=1921087 RepID=A0A2K8L179_9PROT|nr:efflux transporter outer membrane subunit [Mariprofundus ferrinatatus]ATX81037.1 efflux transporter, outer membrane factor (OMF) lipoprotein, NodT family [Mariprofundus ferrinatatus]
MKPFTPYLTCMLLLSACAVGPDFKAPEPPKDATYGSAVTAGHDGGASPKLVTSDAVPEQWWQLFQSRSLSQLVAQGLANSPTLAAAQARLISARETLDADSAWVLFPRADAALNSSRQRISGASFGNAGNPRIFTVHNAALQLSYSIDAFGGGQRYLELGEAGVAYEACQLEAARLTLITNIVTAAVAEASLREQVKATEAIIADATSLLEMSEKQFELGVIGKAELLSQRTTLAQTRSQLPPLQKAVASMRHQLAVLTGNMPDGQGQPEMAMDELVLPDEIPLTIASELTRRRPDVLAAEAALHQANARVGVATSNMYPKLALSASYATEATKIADLFNAGSVVWGLGAGLTQPLFRAGELRARRRAALADFDQAAADYRQRVLTAFADVADALSAIALDGRLLRLETEAEKLAGETLAIVREQHSQGAVSLLMLLDAQQRYQQLRINLIRARAAMFNDTAALMFALGGGWQQGHSSGNADVMEKQQ